MGGKGGGDWIGGGRRVSRLSSLDRASAINRLICYRPWTRVDEFAPPTSQMMLSCCACGATNHSWSEAQCVQAQRILSIHCCRGLTLSLLSLFSLPLCLAAVSFLQVMSLAAAAAHSELRMIFCNGQLFHVFIPSCSSFACRCSPPHISEWLHLHAVFLS